MINGNVSTVLSVTFMLLIFVNEFLKMCLILLGPLKLKKLQKYSLIPFKVAHAKELGAKCHYLVLLEAKTAVAALPLHCTIFMGVPLKSILGVLEYLVFNEKFTSTVFSKLNLTIQFLPIVRLFLDVV